MVVNRRSGKVARLVAADMESAQTGTLHDELLVALTQWRVDCSDSSRSGRLSIRAVARASEDLPALYRPPYDPSCQLHTLSVSGISEVLSGRRKSIQPFDWVASYVLSCLRCAACSRPGRRDQGTTILAHWANIYAAHIAAAGSDAKRAADYQLPQHVQDFVLTHGPYGRILLARAQLGHPHARYRVAMIMACDPALTDEADALLIDVAITGHPLALDLLDTGHDTPAAAAGPGHDLAGSSRLAAARCALDLARTAQANGADRLAYAFYRAADRGGISEAAPELARELLPCTDPELAQWLAQLGTEPATGRHRRRDRSSD
jgi:hypothetical protein